MANWCISAGGFSLAQCSQSPCSRPVGALHPGAAVFPERGWEASPLSLEGNPLIHTSDWQVGIQIVQVTCKFWRALTYRCEVVMWDCILAWRNAASPSKCRHRQSSCHSHCFEDTSESLQDQKRKDSFHKSSSSWILSNFGFVWKFSSPRPHGRSSFSQSSSIFRIKRSPPKWHLIFPIEKNLNWGIPPHSQPTRYHIVA